MESLKFEELLNITLLRRLWFLGYVGTFLYFFVL